MDSELWTHFVVLCVLIAGVFVFPSVSAVGWLAIQVLCTAAVHTAFLVWGE